MHLPCVLKTTAKVRGSNTAILETVNGINVRFLAFQSSKDETSAHREGTLNFAVFSGMRKKVTCTIIDVTHSNKNGELVGRGGELYIYPEQG